MGQLQEKLKGFYNNRWLVFVAAMWLQSTAGIGYLFGSISPVIKSSLNYNQKQIATLGVAKALVTLLGSLLGVCLRFCPYGLLYSLVLSRILLGMVGFG